MPPSITGMAAICIFLYQWAFPSFTVRPIAQCTHFANEENIVIDRRSPPMECVKLVSFCSLEEKSLLCVFFCAWNLLFIVVTSKSTTLQFYSK